MAEIFVLVSLSYVGLTHQQLGKNVSNHAIKILSIFKCPTKENVKP